MKKHAGKLFVLGMCLGLFMAVGRVNWIFSVVLLLASCAAGLVHMEQKFGKKAVIILGAGVPLLLSTLFVWFFTDLWWLQILLVVFWAAAFLVRIMFSDNAKAWATGIQMEMQKCPSCMGKLPSKWGTKCPHCNSPLPSPFD